MVDTPSSAGTYGLGWHDEIDYVYAADRGLNEQHVRDISMRKGEPAGVLQRRLTALRAFQQMPIPSWGGNGELDHIDFDDLSYYMRATPASVRDWDQVPIAIKGTFQRLDIPQAEESVLGGISAQYDSEVVYHRNRAELDRLGVIFTDMDLAVLLCLHAFMVPNLFALAMEPMGDVAGTASALIGTAQVGVRALLASLIDGAFNGTVFPLAIGFVGSGALSLLVVVWAGRRRASDDAEVPLEATG